MYYFIFKIRFKEHRDQSCLIHIHVVNDIVERKKNLCPVYFVSGQNQIQRTCDGRIRKDA